MLRTIAPATLFAIALSAAAQTQPAPFAAGNPAAGKAIVERDCVSCHAQRFADDPNRMYTRPDHRVTTPQKLLAQVQACNTNLGKGYFPEDEENVAAYLNHEFYKFAP
jgi:mono/diheme cytochrome c family protein